VGSDVGQKLMVEIDDVLLLMTDDIVRVQIFYFWGALDSD
jgi:hypothetical protein